MAKAKHNGHLRLDPKNARKHSDRNKALIRQSLDAVGAGRSVLADANGIIRAGNGIYEAWTERGGKVKVIETDRDTLIAVKRKDLKGKEAIRAAALDNLAADSSAYDYDAEILAEIARDDELIAQIAREEKAIAALLKGEAKPEPVDPGDLVDKAAELQKKWKVRRGDLFAIGKHRLLCGDSTNAGDVARLMGNRKAKLFATDPPYGADAGNIGFTAHRDKLEAITNDDLKDTAMQGWLERVFNTWTPHLELNAAWYLWHPMLTQGYFAAAAAAAAAVVIHRQIIWVKEQFIFGRGDYHWQHELCFYGWSQGHRPPFYGERNQSTVWAIPYSEKRSAVGHPTAKPPALWYAPMFNHLKTGELCAEPFAGSGSQFIAGEQQGRVVFGLEIEPKYCAVSLERLSNLGLMPKRVESGSGEG